MSKAATQTKPAAKVNAIPTGYNTITPGLIFTNAKKAMEFYTKALGATSGEICACEESGKIMHAEMSVGTSKFSLADENPMWGCVSAETLKGSPVNFYLYVNDCDASFKKAVDAGMTVKMPVQDMFWGDRTGCVTDPFGYSWTFATHQHDYTKEQIEAGKKAFGEKMKAMKGESCSSTSSAKNMGSCSSKK